MDNLLNKFRLTVVTTSYEPITKIDMYQLSQLVHRTNCNFYKSHEILYSYIRQNASTGYQARWHKYQGYGSFSFTILPQVQYHHRAAIFDQRKKIKQNSK